MSIRKIIKTLSNPTTIKIVAMIAIVGFFLIHPVFADGAETTNTALENLQKSLNTAISLLSRLRVILAILAGKLMTNDFVYGAFLHMDIYLWKIRNIMKNFANFALVGLVLRGIIKGIVGKDALNPKKIITDTLVAGILIQASWFMMGALVDISTIATTAISAFPMSFIQNDGALNTAITNSIDKFKATKLVIDLKTGKHSVDPISSSSSNDDIRQSILPNNNSVSGPFIFLGMGVFHFQDYLGAIDSPEIKTLTLGFLLRFFWLFIFSVGLLLLFIANLMRIGLLRIFIIGSPFLILMQFFKFGEGKGIAKIFKLSNLLAVVFKPVIFVMGISLMLIVIVSMQRGMTSSGTKRESNLNGVVLSVTGANKNTSKLTIEGITDIQVNQKGLLTEGVITESKNFFSDTLILFLSIFLMRGFVKLSLKLGGGTIEETMGKLIGHVEGMAKSAPILGGFSVGGVGSVMEKNRNQMLGGVGLNTSGEFGAMKDGRFEKNSDKFSDWVDEKVLGTKPGWKSSDAALLSSIATSSNNYTTFFNKSIEIAKNRNGGVSLSSSGWETSLKTLLSDHKYIQFNNPQRGINFTQWGSDQTAEQYFKVGTNAASLYNAMDGATTAKTKSKPGTYEELKNIDFNSTE